MPRANRNPFQREPCTGGVARLTWGRHTVSLINFMAPHLNLTYAACLCISITGLDHSLTSLFIYSGDTMMRQLTDSGRTQTDRQTGLC
jgi:hypothetical protein